MYAIELTSRADRSKYDVHFLFVKHIQRCKSTVLRRARSPDVYDA